MTPVESRVVVECLALAARCIDPLLDCGPVDLYKLTHGSLQSRLSALQPLAALTKTGMYAVRLSISEHQVS